MRVLIADDHPSIRSALTLLLEQSNLDVVGSFANSHELLEWLKTQQTDLLLLDWELPGESSKKLLTILRSRYPSIRVIVLSSLPQTRVAALQAGANCFVCEGEPPEYLLSSINSCCSSDKSNPLENNCREGTTDWAGK